MYQNPTARLDDRKWQKGQSLIEEHIKGIVSANNTTEPTPESSYYQRANTCHYLNCRLCYNLSGES